jgi:hypothetical protein
MEEFMDVPTSDTDIFQLPFRAMEDPRTAASNRVKLTAVSHRAVAPVVASVVLTFTELQTQHRVLGSRMRRVVLLSLWMSMARADVTADFDAFEVERRAKAAIDMAGCPERTQWQHATLPNELEPGIPSAVYWLLSLFSIRLSPMRVP